MKKTRFLLFLPLLALCFFAPCVTATEILNTPLVDMGDFLTEDQELSLSARLSELRDALEFDIAVFTEMSTEGNEPRARAESICDSILYGAEDMRHGILLYFNRERDYYLVVGTTTDEISQQELDILDREVSARLSQGDYFDACLVFSENAAAFAQSTDDVYSDTGYYDGYYSTESEMGLVPKILIFVIILPLVIALCLTLVRQRRMNTARGTDDAHAYAGRESFRLSTARDIFLYSTVTKTPKPKPQSGTGRGGGISGGRSRGGKF